MGLMRALFFLPVDTLAKNLAARIAEEGWSVSSTHGFREFRQKLNSADLVLINYSKSDDAKYVLKMFAATLLARLRRKRTVLLLTIDPVDICDRRVFRRALVWLNFVLLRFPQLIVLLGSRAHIARRYRLSSRRVIFAENFPLPRLWSSAMWQPPTHSQPETIRFFYHGELLWWHGIEQFESILDELKKRHAAQMVIAGNLYPTGFQIFGFPLCRKEIEIKERIHEFLNRSDVLHLGRIDPERVQEEMLRSDFHISQLRTGDQQAETELRTCLLEAMAVGMPCVHAATHALSSHPELRDGENIIVIDPGEPAACAERILRLCDSAESLSEIGMAARRTIAECFDFEGWFSKFRARVLAPLEKGQKRSPTAESHPLLDVITRPLFVPIYVLLALASYPCVKLVKPLRSSRRNAARNKKQVVAPPLHPSSYGDEHAVPDITVVVPALNAESTIEACIDSLLALNYPHDKIEIVIVDNGSTDRTRELVRRYAVRLVEEGRRGAGAARNAGVRAAHHPLIAFMDSDCVAHPDWLRELARAFALSSYDALGGAIRGSDLTPDIERFYRTYGILDQESAISGGMLPLPFVITANCLFKRETFERVGGFDERFPGAAAEDVDLSWRISDAGGTLGYCADAVVYHRHRILASDLYFQFYKYGRSEVYLYQKHRSRFSRRQLRELLWIRWNDYRCFWRMIGAMLYNGLMHPQKSRQNLFYILKELGHVCGKLHAHLRLR